MSHTLQLLLLLAIIIACAKWAGSLSLRWGQPAVFGKILIGLILGPTLLNILGWPIFLDPATTGTMDASVAHASPVFNTIKDMAEIGVILLMFLAGLETDINKMKTVGRAALGAAAGGVFLPLFAGIAVAATFAYLGLNYGFYEVLFIGTILTATSVSISAQTLMELGAIKSREGMTILGAAVIDDILGIILLSVVIAFRPGAGIEHARERLLDHIMVWLRTSPFVEAYAGPVRVLVLVVLMVLFVLIAWLGFKYAFRYIRYMGRQPITGGLLAGAIVVGLLFAWMAEFIGNLAAITGSYLAGVLIAQTHLRDQIEHRVQTLTYGLFVSIFFISIGLEADARTIFAPLAHVLSMTREEWLVISFALLIVVVAIVTKAWGCMAGAMFAGFTRKQAFRVGVGMISRGEVGLIVASVGLSAGVINAQVFSMMILMVLVTTLVTPIWLRYVMAGREEDASEESVESLS